MDPEAELVEALRWLAEHGSEETIAGLDRFGIDAREPFGVGVGELRHYARALGRSHRLAELLWETGHYEARLLAAFVGEPEQLTVARMNAWAKDFDNWAVVDTVCFHLFDRSPLAWKRIPVWARAKAEFTKRAAFALLWGLSIHAKDAADERFLEYLPWIEAAADDPRLYVKKAVNMALRAVGKRSPGLHAEALAMADRLGDHDAPSRRWIGRHAARELRSAKVRAKLGL